MTRLQTRDIAGIISRLTEYDAELKTKTGHTLMEIGCLAAGIEIADARNAIGRHSVCALTMTCGQGPIPGFAETLRAIAAHLGFVSFTVNGANVAGLAEAVENQADIILSADDERFVAVNLKSRRVIDNRHSTGKGFATGLTLLGSSRKINRVLVIGCGPVGQSACLALAEDGVQVSVFDICPKRCTTLAGRAHDLALARVAVVKDLKKALANHDYIVDATPAKGIIDVDAISDKTCISAPGVPLGVSRTAMAKLSGRLLHDPLQVGVATMLMAAIGTRRF